MNRIKGDEIGKKILQAQKKNELCGVDMDDYRETPTLKMKQFRVQTYDGAHLDTLEITHKNDNNPLEKPYLINFLGSSQIYQEKRLMDMMLADAVALQCNVVGFNFRNVLIHQEEKRIPQKEKGDSPPQYKGPQSEDELVIDGIAQVKRLLNKDVPAEKILLNGVSLGAAIATRVAKYFHDNTPHKVNLFHDRGFTSVTHTAVSWAQIGILTSGSSKMKT